MNRGVTPNKGGIQMGDTILKLHIAVMGFVHERIDAYRERNERGFTTAELLANAALGVVALAAIWGLFQTDILTGVLNLMKEKIGIH